MRIRAGKNRPFAAVAAALPDRIRRDRVRAARVRVLTRQVYLYPALGAGVYPA